MLQCKLKLCLGWLDVCPGFSKIYGCLGLLLLSLVDLFQTGTHET